MTWRRSTGRSCGRRGASATATAPQATSCSSSPSLSQSAYSPVCFPPRQHVCALVQRAKQAPPQVVAVAPLDPHVKSQRFRHRVLPGLFACRRQTQGFSLARADVAAAGPSHALGCSLPAFSQPHAAHMSGWQSATCCADRASETRHATCAKAGHS